MSGPHFVGYGLSRQDLLGSELRTAERFCVQYKMYIVAIDSGTWIIQVECQGVNRQAAA